jgi:hypothetical protein
MMTEEFIHFIWKFRMLKQGLRTTSGEELQVINPGEHNTDSGPDFFNARIRIGETLWAGNVEMHVLASDWNRHKHSSDQAYANTILHVVQADDAVIRLPAGDAIPTLVIGGQYPPGILDRYEALMQNRQWIPCYNLLSVTPVPGFPFWAPSLAVERLLGKAERIRELLKNAEGDWEEACYQWLAHGFGFRINAFPFELLARSLPFRVLSRYRSSPLQTEALLFGQAGLLNSSAGGDYLKRLRIEYGFLQAKHTLVPLQEGLWKFLRLRPSNFPTIRISQFGNLITKRDALLSFILSCPGISEIDEWFDIRAAAFWDDHFTFDRLSPASEKKLGDVSARLLAINVVAPFLFCYGIGKDSKRHREHAVQILESLPPEDNLDIRNWRAAGLEVADALRTQALLQLKSSYCDNRRCLSCRIGRTLLDLKNGAG